MRNKTMIAALVAVAITGVGAGVSLARPGDHKAPDQNVNVTVVAGKGRIGVSVLQISNELRTHLGAPADRGVLVENVRADSPGAKAGLQVGDVIVDIDGKNVAAATDLLSAMSDRKKGDTVTIGAIRDSRRIDMKVTLEDDGGGAWQSQQMWNSGGNWNLNPQDMMKDWNVGAGDPMLRSQLDAALHRIDQLERRIDRLEHPRT
jgi:membrane-associated protease RseP (regulator of RpoE activity)